MYKSLVQDNSKEQYLREVHEVNTNNLKEDENEDWIAKYAKIQTRAAVQISTNIKLNPHEPDSTKNIIPQPLKYINGKNLAGVHQGGKLNAILTFSGELIITTKHDLYNALEQTKSSEEYKTQETLIVQQKVTQVAVGGQDLAYIDEFKQVFSVLCHGQEIAEPYKINLQEPIKLISVAQNHSFAVTTNNKIYCWIQGVNMLPPQQVQGFDQTEEIIDIKSGNTQTIILTNSQRVYKIDYCLDQEQNFKAEIIKKLNKIVQIASSFIHFIALQREDIQPLKDWSSTQVSEWFTNIGLGEASNLVKFKQINGDQIFNADEDYMSDTLGYTSVFEHQKLKFEIGKVREGTIGKMNIYGWGSNKNGQLGLLQNNVHDPKLIPIPEFKDPKDYIVSVSCGLKSTSLITKQGETWITGYYQQEKLAKPTVNDDSDTKNFKSQRKMSENIKKHIKTDEDLFLFKAEQLSQKKKNMKNQKRKTNQYFKNVQEYKNEAKKLEDKEKSLKHRWQDFTHIFSQACFGKNYQVESISIGVKNIVAICSYSFKIKLKKQNKHKQGLKFTGADKVIKFLAFKQSISAKKKFTVCYEDRFLGILEADLDTFLDNGDIPFHRIQFFKDNGEIIWDRKKKFTII